MFFSKETPVHVLALDILTEFVESTVIFLNTPMNVCQKVSTLWQYQQTTWQRMNKTHGGIVNLSLIPVTEVQVSYLKLQVRYISNYQNTCFVLKILNRVLFIFFFFFWCFIISIFTKTTSLSIINKHNFVLLTNWMIITSQTIVPNIK